MKKNGVLNNMISEVIASMGHTDMLTICDAGFPIPDAVKRIDIALISGVPSFLVTVDALKSELEIEQIVLAEEILEKNPGMESDIKRLLNGIDIVYMPHNELIKLSEKSKAVIRTGECTPYSNVVLRSGVVF